MPQESRSESGTRLARDMRRIREVRHLTVHDLHEETKIPLGLIEAFEASALFDHPQFNRVYLRSFARTYAQVVGIEADLALQALEEALAGTYSGSLAVQYLGEQPEAPAPAEQPAEIPPVSPPIETPESAEAEEQKRKRDRGPAKRPQKKKKSEQPPTEEPRSPILVSTTGETAAGYERINEPEGSSEDWTTQSPPSGARTTVQPARERPRRTESSRGWIIGGTAVVIVALVVWAIVGLSGDDDAEIANNAADTVAAEQPVTAPVQNRPIPTLGDSISVQLIASQDKLDPIRVTVDDDLRRPYWLELGDSMQFKPVNRIVIEEQLDDISVRIEGIEYPTSRRDESGRLVITRDSIREYFASAPSEVLEQLADTAAQDTAAQAAQ